MNVATVCRKFYVLSNDRSLWRELTFAGSTPTTETICLLLRKSRGLYYLQIVERNDATVIIKEVCRSNNKLRTLIINRCRGKTKQYFIHARVICNLINRCRDLENLTIKETYIRSMKFYNILGQMLPNLRKVHLEVASGVLGIFARTCNKLEEVSTYRFPIEFYKIHVAKYADIERFCTKMHETLTVLKLSIYYVGNDAMDCIVKCCHLCTLNIYHARNIDDVGLMKIAQLQNLTSLAITDAHLITGATWIELMGEPSLSHLRNLEIWRCPTLNEDVLKVMKINCQYLEELELVSVNIRNRDNADIAEGFRRMKKITFLPNSH